MDNLSTNDEFDKIDNEIRGNNKKSAATLLVEIVEATNSIELFRNETGETFAHVLIDNHFETWRTKSQQFEYWLRKIYLEKYKKVPSNNSVKEAVANISGKAYFLGNQYVLSNRVAKIDDALWYDLADKMWKAVKITKIGWEIVDNPPILFRRYSHQLSQVIPMHNGDIKNVLKFVNLPQKEQQILFLVWLVSCFIPGFPHPIPHIYGSQGSAKSSLSRVIRQIVDPSEIDVSELPRNYAELIQKLAHHWCIVFDNISYLTEDISDLLCRAITGAGFSKRELYSNDEDVIYHLKQCIALNGINLVATRPDLLERCILFGLERVSKDNRMEEQDLFKKFEIELPNILGGIFDVLSRTLQIHPTIRLTELPRMADFATWGCAIAESIGYSRDEFLTAYNNNIAIQNSEIISENDLAGFVMALMENNDNWIGTPQELFEAIKNIAYVKFSIDVYREKSFPRATNAFMRRLNCLKSNLEEMGINIFNERTQKRRVAIRKTDKYVTEISRNDEGN